MSNANYAKSNITSNELTIEYPSIPSSASIPDLSLKAKLEMLEEKQKQQTEIIEKLIRQNERLGLRMDDLGKYCFCST